MVVHVVYGFGRDDGEIERLDVATTLASPIVNVKMVPKISHVTRGTKLALILLILAASAVCLFYMGFIFVHRNHQIIRMARGSLLFCLMALLLVGCISLFFLLPENDLLCKLRGHMILIPFHAAVVVILVCIWRVQVTLSSAFAFARTETKSRCGPFEALTNCFSFLASVPFCIKRSGNAPRNNICKTVTSRKATVLIIILTLPQVVLQGFAAFYYEKESTLLTVDETLG